jgi:hypothetical protein
MNQEITSEVASLVRKMERDYTTGETTISKYVKFSQYENIEKIDAYLNSKHISGDTDALGREKPFFNIVTAVVNLWYRATDIDRKDIRVKSTKISTVVAAFIATLKLQEWMRKARFGVFLNEWGRGLAKYGSVPVKFVEDEDSLYISVVPWGKLISDTVSFASNPKIEILYFTEGELRKAIDERGYDKNAVENLISTAGQRRELVGGESVDNISEYFKLYELHGNFPTSWISEDEIDEGDYSQQMHVVSYVAGVDGDDEDNDDFTLYKGYEKKDPYMLTHLMREDNREQSIGAVEYLFDSQWMVNSSMKAIKDQLDLASKMIFQTADGNFVGLNVLSDMETGDILIHTQNQPLEAVNNGSHDIGTLKTFADMFINNGRNTTGATDAITGNNMPSGTSFSLGQMLNGESHDLFEIMTENKGFAITDMMHEFILPFIRKSLKNKDEISEFLADNDIQTIDSMFIPNEAIRRINKRQAEDIFNGMIAQPEDPKVEQDKIQKELATMGTQRFLKPDELDQKTWDDILADLEKWDIEVETTNEGSDKKAVLQTLSTVLQTIAQNPNILQDPNQRMILNKILEETGVFSAMQLKAPPAPPQPDPQASGGDAKSVGNINQITQ